MMDPANDPEWIGRLREAELLDGDGVAVGSHVHRGNPAGSPASLPSRS